MLAFIADEVHDVDLPLIFHLSFWKQAVKRLREAQEEFEARDAQLKSDVEVRRICEEPCYFRRVVHTIEHCYNITLLHCGLESIRPGARIACGIFSCAVKKMSNLDVRFFMKGPQSHITEAYL